MCSQNKPVTKRSFRFTTLDIVIMVTTGAVFGLIGLGLNASFFLLSGVLGVAWASNLLAGPFFSCGLLAARILRKPGVSFITQMLFSVASVLLGDPFGLTNLGFGFVQGIAFEIIFAVFRYKRWDWWVILLAAFLATIFDIGPLYVFTGLGEQPLWTWLGPLMLRPLFVLPIVYILAVSVPNLLQKAGVIKQS
jgi:energy-coupling factor transport system substrate-specific component